MLPVWRVTRTRHARRAYDVLKTLGVTATWMYEYRTGSLAVDASTPPTGVSVETWPADAAIDLGLDGAPGFEPRDGELAAVAVREGRPVGRALVGADGVPYVGPLERAVAVRGAYVRRVFVATDERGRGVATAVLARALAAARERLDATAACALVAADNRPSRRLFEGCGFESDRRHEYVRVGPVSHYRVGPA